MGNIKHFVAAAASCGLFLSLVCACGAEEHQLTPEHALIAGSGGDWYAVEDGDLMAWGELHGGTDYGQRVTEFEGAQAVWGYRFGQLVLDENGDLWTTGTSGYNEPRTRDGWQFVLSDVVTASGSDWNGAAVCSDGSLWTWGKNDHGQLANGQISEDGTDYPPQHIMDGVCKVRSASYVVTLDGALYGMGLWPGCAEPMLLCEDVADAAAVGSRRIQILTTEGELYLAAIPDRAGQKIQLPDKPDVSNVSRVFDGGYAAVDGTYFLWNHDGSRAVQVDVDCVQIAENLDGFLLLTEDGTYVRAKIEEDGQTLRLISDQPEV